jgi:AcrR family transcriptional regulator
MSRSDAPSVTPPATMAPLRRDAARNRERLLDAAATVFAEQGLGASVDEVARVAGVGMGTLYRRFPTKEALIDALVGELLDDLLTDARAALEAPDGLGLEAFLDDVGAHQSARLGCLPRLWNTPRHQDVQAEIRVVIAALLADAQAHGRMRAELEPADVFAITWSLRGVIETTRAAAPDAWRRHLEILLAGLRPAPAPLAQEPLPRAVVQQIVENAPV